jgi:glycosyltransferase involved in cell wall biosynthesis
VATSWGTAHVLARHGGAPMRRLYLVQDFEPWFYPRGAEYALAEDTYRFGFRCVTVGPMLADLLRDRFGVEADIVEFGCDNDVYRLEDAGPRDGVVFYTKPHAARRGFLLGVLALAELHRRRPEVPIHTVGDADIQVPFPATNHGVCPPEELGRLYNRTRVGLALSFTNLTLLADELLACGTVPVINDDPYPRASLDSDHARWAVPTPSGIADAMLEVIDAPPDLRKVAASARKEGWRPGQAAFVRAIEEETYEPSVVRP